MTEQATLAAVKSLATMWIEQSGGYAESVEQQTTDGKAILDLIALCENGPW